MPHAENSILRARDPTTDAVIANLREVYEPELLVNVYDLGLIYDIQVEPRSCKVMMTLVSSWCPPDGYAEGCCPVEGRSAWGNSVYAGCIFASASHRGSFRGDQWEEPQ